MESLKKDQGVIFSKEIQSRNRKYFFDVRKTRNGGSFLSITESLKKKKKGKVETMKQKIFIYKEDFNEFMDRLDDVIDFMNK